MGGDSDRFSSAEAASTLGWWIEAGVDAAIAETPRNWLEPKAAPSASRSRPLTPTEPEMPLPEAADTLDLFRDWLETAPALPLANAGAKRVLPHGAEAAPVMIIAEMPTGEDAAEGRPIAGAAWQLMERMLAAIGISADARLQRFAVLFPFARRANEPVGHRGLRRYRPPPHCRRQAATPAPVRRRAGARLAWQAADRRSRPCSQDRRDSRRNHVSPALFDEPSVGQGSRMARSVAVDGGRRLRVALFAIAALLVSQPAAAQTSPDPLAPISEAPDDTQLQTIPTVVSRPQATEPTIVYAPQATVAQPAAPIVTPVRIPRDWREVFAAIRSGNWSSASAGIAVLPPSVLTPAGQGRALHRQGLARGRPQPLQALLAEAPELPQAEQIARMAFARGATATPPILARRQLTWLGRRRAGIARRPIQGEPAADQLRPALDPLIKADAPADAEVALAAVRDPSSRSKPAPRRPSGSRGLIMSTGRDADARRVADTWRVGATGEWATQSAWISGLASWRLNDCESASRAFREVAATSRERELGAGGYYWAARSEQACRRPQLGRAAAARRGAVERELLWPDRPRDAGHGHAVAGGIAPFRCARSKICPMSAAPTSWSGSASTRWPKSCFVTRPGSAARPTITA